MQTKKILTAKAVDKLKIKKAALQQQIYICRADKSRLNTCLDLAFKNKSYSHLSKESPIKLVNELYQTNQKLNSLRDQVDTINKKLYNREEAIKSANYNT